MGFRIWNSDNRKLVDAIFFLFSDITNTLQTLEDKVNGLHYITQILEIEFMLDHDVMYIISELEVLRMAHLGKIMLKLIVFEGIGGDNTLLPA